MNLLRLRSRIAAGRAAVTPYAAWPSQQQALATLCLVLTIGCGQSGAPRFAISGQVRYDGQLVEQGSLGLTPLAPGAPTAGADIINGRYEIPAHAGPAAGAYRVWIEAQRPSGRKIQADEGSAEKIDEMVQYLPSIYNLDSELTVEIIDDRSDLDFLLEKPTRGRK